jgi:hypothetical protein
MTSRNSNSASAEATHGEQTLCYCLGITEQDLHEEYDISGQCFSRELIRDLVRSGNCACATENPSGTCCLGEVDMAIRHIQATCKKNKAADSTGRNGREPGGTQFNSRRSA